MQRILVPVDFSSHSVNAFKTACFLAKQINAQIILLHVIHLPFHLPSRNKNKFDKIKSKAHSRLKKLANQIRTDNHTAQDVRISTYILSGLASPTILQTIRKADCDLLIMGRKGETEIEKLAVGSVAKDVVLHSKIPVFLVSESTNISDYKHLLFTTDFHSGDLVSLNKAVDLANKMNAQITVLHVTNNGIDLHAEEKFNTHLKKDAKFNKIQLVVIKEENIFDGLRNYLQEKPVSLLAVTRYKKSAFSTLNYKKQVQKLLEDSQIPVLIFAGK